MHPVLREELRGLLDERLAEVAEPIAGFQPLHELGCRGDADVGGDQRFLETFPRLVVGGVERLERQLLGQRAAALAERVTETREEAAALLLFPRRLVGLAEHFAQVRDMRREG